MAGELNGTKVLIAKDGGDIVGQMEATITYGGTPIETSNKSNNDFVTYMDGELATKQCVISGTITYNNNAVYLDMKADSDTGTQDTYTATYAVGDTTDEVVTGVFVPSGITDSASPGERVTTAFTLSSSGSYTRTPYAA